MKNAEQLFQDNFESIYLSHYQGMIRFAREYIMSVEDAENIVQDAFAEIWETRKGFFRKKSHLLALLFRRFFLHASRAGVSTSSVIKSLSAKRKT